MEKRGKIDVVIVTRNRAESLIATLERLMGLAEKPGIIVADNGSTDGTPQIVRGRYPDVDVIEAGRNMGSAARTLGVQASNSEFIAFCDDDSWWPDGALRGITDIFGAYPALGLVAAKLLVGEDQKIDPVSLAMADSPLRCKRDLPGPPILGFAACGAAVRRQAYLAAGGFHQRFGVGGEEQLLALDLVTHGWDLCYVDRIIAHHHPSPSRNVRTRSAVEVRNMLWTSWLREHAGVSAARTTRLVRDSLLSRDHRSGVKQAILGLPWVLGERSPVTLELQEQLLSLDQRRSEPSEAA